MQDSFEDVLFPSLEFLRQRRFDLFNPEGNNQEEAVRKYIKEGYSALQQVANGKFVEMFGKIKKNIF